MQAKVFTCLLFLFALLGGFQTAPIQGNALEQPAGAAPSTEGSTYSYYGGLAGIISPLLAAAQPTTVGAGQGLHAAAGNHKSAFGTLGSALNKCYSALGAAPPTLGASLNQLYAGFNTAGAALKNIYPSGKTAASTSNPSFKFGYS